MSAPPTALDALIKTLTAALPKVARQGRYRLQILTGPDAGKQHDFTDRARIGARMLADLVLQDPKVSGLHCEISAGGALRVRDLGSKNGTFVNGVRVLDAMLTSGDAVDVGGSRVRVAGIDQEIEVPLLEGSSFHGIIGRSAKIRALTARIARLADEDLSVLIQGETGSGKERVAEALHFAGRRAGGPLEVVDCGSLPPGLIEATLYGHERGAFTGATQSVPGAFERADGGTLFIDEVGELPLELQPRLLRAVETRTVRRLGGEDSRTIDVRVVAATNRDLALETVSRRFRLDLYHRLAAVVLDVPPLREHLDDLPLLAVHLLGQLGVDPASCLTLDSLAELSSHHWPGNVRELKNTLERAVSLHQPPRLEPIEEPASVGPPAAPGIDLSISLPEGKQRVIQSYERGYLMALFEECGGNLSEVARRAGMDRISIRRMMGRLGLSRWRAR